MVSESKFSVSREYPPIGKYRVRVIVRQPGEYVKTDGSKIHFREEESFLDIREYASLPAFEGFTKRGIRIPIEPGGAKLELLLEILEEVLSNAPGRDPKEAFVRRMTSVIASVKELKSSDREGVVPAQAEEGKEVSVNHCTLCQREVPALGPASGVGYKEETLCGVCLKSAQKVCPHSLRKEDGVTCRDCGARPWTAKRVALGVLLGAKSAAVGFVKLFMMYTLPSAIGSAVVAGILFLIGRKMGVF